jgi:hypothetical protein
VSKLVDRVIARAYILRALVEIESLAPKRR